MTPADAGRGVVVPALFVLASCGGSVGPKAETPGAEQAALPASAAPAAAADPAVPCGPGIEPNADGSCPVRAAPSAETKRGGSASSAPPQPRSHGVPGGLSRGDGTPADAALEKGDRAYFEGDYVEARKKYEEAEKLAPQDAAPKVGLLRVRIAEADVPTAYAAAPGDRLMRGLLGGTDALLKTHGGYGPLFIERGRIQLILGRAEAALESLERAVALSPADPEAHSALGVARLATGDPRRALERFRRAAELDPGSPDRLTNLGTAYMMRGRVSEALRAYTRAVELAPDDPRARGDLGTAYLAANRPADAMPHLERAVELAPERATFLNNLGYAYQQAGQLDRAIETYRRALKKDESLGSAWINLGTALAAKKRYDEAEDAFKKALALDPTDPRAKANLSELRQLRQK